MPSTGKPAGHVFTFESREDLFLSYVYVLVQIPDGVPEEQAERYGEVLQEA